MRRGTTETRGQHRPEEGESHVLAGSAESRREQPVEQVEKIGGNPVIEEKRQEASSSADPVMQDNEEAPIARARKNPARSHKRRIGQTRAFVPGAFRAGPRKILIVEWQRMRTRNNTGRDG